MGDGDGDFSGPDPALGDLPDGDDDDPFFETRDDVVAAFEDEATMVPPGTSCDNCAHQEVCQLYVGFKSSLQNFMRERVTDGRKVSGGDLLEEAPMQPEDLAWHCDAYTPEV